ncbi:MAG: ABC transporter permease [Bacteroidales bacterium]|nr:ABC transporter permease [Bacteroidales bacterium]
MRFFEFDTLQEIFATMRESKLRTFLTGFAVAWGIFMLILLLGSGNGLKNGISSNFNDRASNTVEMWGRMTTMPYKGFKSQRTIHFTNHEIEIIKAQYPQVDKISGRLFKNPVVSYKDEYGNFSLEGVMPDYLKINNTKIEPGNGRLLNQIDMQQERKVIVLSQKIVDNLFKKGKPLGQWVKVDNISYQVVGIDTKTSNEEGGHCYIPLSTAQKIYDKADSIDNITLTVNGLYTKEANEEFGKDLKKTLSRVLIVDPDDEQAIGMWNQAADYVQTMKIFSTINLFVLFIGLCTLIAGIVGVGNIMVITVKERTREFGIKKALGATPGNILLSILLESVVITTTFGYIGLLFGVGLLELISKAISMSSGGGKEGSQSMSIFLDPSVDLSTAILATLILIFSGLIAGYIPARKAVRIKPIEAMRAD